MKKLQHLFIGFLVATAISFTPKANAQAPQGIPYQAVARDNAGNLIKSQIIALRFTIHDGSTAGPVVYSETHSVTTDELGLFSVNIGGGASTETLAAVNWGSGAKFTQVEVDVTGGSNYTDMGTTQMMSVPYALYAGSAGSATSMGSIGDSPTANGGTITSGVLNLTPADASNGGIVTTGDQTFAGAKTFSSDIIINGINAGAGGGGLSVKFGAGALATNYGNTNSAFGTAAMQNNTSGYDNTAVGWNANSANTIGAGNTAIGVRSLEGNSEGNNLTAIGHIASVGSPDLVNATVIGAYATVSNSNQIQLGNGSVTSVNTSGTYTGAGFKTPNGQANEFLMADGSVSTGGTGGAGVFVATTANADNISNVNAGNVGIGTDLPSEKLEVNGNLRVRGTLNNMNIGNLGSGTTNVALGDYAYNTDASGDGNTSIGFAAMQNSTTGWNNVAVGVNALNANTTGFWNNAIGYSSLIGNTAGIQNVGLGNNTLTTNTTGSQNTAIGNQSDVAASDLNNATAIGNFAIVDASNKIQLGNGDVTSVNTSGTYTGAGFKTPNGQANEFLMADGTTSAGTAATTMGSIGDSPSANGGTITSGVLNLTPADASNGGVVTTGDQTFAGSKTFVSDLNVNGITVGTRGGNLGNTVIGGNALANNSTGYWNNAIGANALSSNSTGYYNVADGSNALISNTTGNSNTAMGVNTLQSNTTGAGNIAIGTSSLQASNANYNIALGSAALFSNTSGTENVASGTSSIFQNTTGNYNTANGTNALYSNVSGSNNTALGYQADVAAAELSNATAIGSGAKVAESNTIQLGNADVTSVNTSGTYTGAGFKTPNGTNTEFLMADGSTSAGTAATSMGSIGDSPTANGGTINSGVLSLTPADENNGGIVTAGDQNFAGAKTFYGDLNIYNVGLESKNVNIYNKRVNIYNNNNSFTNPIGTNLNVEGGLSHAGVEDGNYPLYSTVDISGGKPDYNSTPTAIFDNLTALHLTSPENYFGNNTSGWWALLTDGDVKVNGNILTSGTYTGAGFKTPNGTSSEYLMADGSVSTGGTGATSAIIRGNVASDGTVSIGTGFSSYINTIGYYSITFNTPFTTLPIVVATLQNSFGFISVTNVTTTGFTVVIGNTLGSFMSGDFSFIVMPQ